MKRFFLLIALLSSTFASAQLNHFYGFRQAYDSLYQLEYQYNDTHTFVQTLYYPMAWKDSSEVHIYAKLFLDTTPASYATPANFLVSTPSGEVKRYTGTFPAPTDTTSLSNRINAKLGIAAAAALYQPIGSYLTSETDPLFDTKLATKTTSNLTEGSNLYWTQARFDTRFSLKTTTDLAEGSNLYFTSARVDARVQAYTGDVTLSGSTFAIGAGKVTNSMIAAVGWSKITGTPTTVSGYGITDAFSLPSMTGNSGKYLTTNGTTASWATVPVSNYSAPNVGNSITSGTAFQPNSSGACNVLISTTLGAGIVGLRGTSVIAMSSTQNGTYTDVGPGTSFAITILNVADSRDGISIPVPSGYWVKVTNTAVGLGATLTSTYTRWNIQ